MFVRNQLFSDTRLHWLGEDTLLAEIETAYDDDGDVVEIGDLSVERNPATGFVEATSLLGVIDERSYNGYGEYTNYVAKFENADLYRSSVTRDALGRVVEREERVLAGDAVTSRYAYDVRGRLVSVTTNGVVAESYAYDANGNRLGGTYDAQDRQLAVDGAAYAYDLNGSMTNRNGTALAWSLFGRLLSVGGVSYARDEQQRMRRKAVDGVPVKEWMWQGSRLVVEHDLAADETSVFVYAGATAPAYMIRGDDTYRFVTDNQGSVRLVVDAATGEVLQRLDYDAFGRVVRDTNPGFQPFGFQGGLYDPDTGLVEFGCRWYDAETGRWISKDPILLDGGWNVYAFCDNDPVNRTDPSGCATEIGLIGARAAAVLGGHASVSLLLNGNGRIGLKLKVGVGTGVEVGVKGPWNANRAIRHNSPSVGVDGSKDIEFGIEHGIEGHGGVVVGISFDPTKEQPVNGLEVGSIGGGVYTSSAVVIPIFDPSWFRGSVRNIFK